MHRPPPFCRLAVVFLIGTATVALPSREAVAQEKEPTKLESTTKRRTRTTEEDLRKQLQSVPEAGFDQQTAGELYVPIIKGMQATPPLKNLPADLGSMTLHEKAARDNRPDMGFLPWITGPDNELIKEEAEHLQELSFKLRLALLKSVKRDKDERTDPDKLPPLLAAREWTTPTAVPTLTQMMQAESASVRLLLVDMLAKIDGKEASIALAKRAVFDLSPDVRARAIWALTTRPAGEYTPILYDGFRYPWPAAADHAAAAVVDLERIDMVPELVKLLKEPSPTSPVKVEGGYTVQEVVRINHLCNCVLCHPPSLNKGDLVRRSVPIPGERVVAYYERSGSLFVRADLTYLRQDFSVVQPVAKPGKWPGEQRYDYLVRTRPLSQTEQAALLKAEKDGARPKSYPQQESVLFALRELTGRDHGTTYDDWNSGLQKPAPQQSSKGKPDPQKP